MPGPGTVRYEMATNGQGPDPPPPRLRSPLRIRVVIVALALVGIVGFVVAALLGSRDDADRAVTAGPAVDQVIPNPGDQVLQQQRVGVVLDARYRLSSMVILPSQNATEGVDVTSEVEHTDGLNRFEFAPGEGRLIEALSPDTNCVIARFVLIARPEESDTVRWCFEVS